VLWETRGAARDEETLSAFDQPVPIFAVDQQGSDSFPTSSTGSTMRIGSDIVTRNDGVVGGKWETLDAGVYPLGVKAIMTPWKQPCFPSQGTNSNSTSVDYNGLRVSGTCVLQCVLGQQGGTGCVIHPKACGFAPHSENVHGATLFPRFALFMCTQQSASLVVTSAMVRTKT